MAKLQWLEHYRTGLPLIDQQHQEFFRRLNAFNEALEEGRRKEAVIQALTFLLDYASLHFRAEERGMEEAGFPGLAAHREKHRLLEERTRTLLDRYRRGELFLAMQVSLLLSEWIVQHILHEDMAYVPHLKSDGVLTAPAS
ncbi:MAG: hemerythrin family protein [Elusimicrobia bacterium]|nr:hemerythrin family protein [Elusimicrobiota bacterium]